MTTVDLARPVEGVTDVGYLRFLIKELKGKADSVLSAAQAAKKEDSAPQAQPSMRDETLTDQLIDIGRAFKLVWGGVALHPEFAQLVKRSYENTGRSMCCITISKGLTALDSQVDQLLLRSPVFTG